MKRMEVKTDLNESVWTREHDTEMKAWYMRFYCSDRHSILRNPTHLSAKARVGCHVIVMGFYTGGHKMMNIYWNY